MTFQIVALTLDADDNVIERRVVPRPYPTRKEAVTAIEWWAIAHDGDRTRFIIEGVQISRPEWSPQLGS